MPKIVDSNTVTWSESSNELSATVGGDVVVDSVVIDDGGTIGSASDTDALTISSGGVLNFTQEPTVTGEDIYYQGNIVGTVSQSSGDPTGAVIERGSNANGEYVKYADGTMICWRNDFTVTYANAVRLTSGFTYPAAFVDTAVSGLVSLNDTDTETLGFAKSSGALVHRTTSSSAGQIRLYADETALQAGDAITVNFCAVGGWF